MSFAVTPFPSTPVLQPNTPNPPPHPASEGLHFGSVYGASPVVTPGVPFPYANCAPSPLLPPQPVSGPSQHVACPPSMSPAAAAAAPTGYTPITLTANGATILLPVVPPPPPAHAGGLAMSPVGFGPRGYHQPSAAPIVRPPAVVSNSPGPFPSVPNSVFPAAAVHNASSMGALNPAGLCNSPFVDADSS